MTNDIGVTSAWLDQEDRRTTEIVRSHGCFIQVVLASDDAPTFAYTVGLFGIGHPELLVFGLDMESAGGVLNGLYEVIRAGGDLIPGEVIAVPGCSTRVLVETLPNPGEILYAANRHYQRPSEVSVPAYQLTWDVDGAFPWEPGYPYSESKQPRPGSYGPL